MVEIGVVEIGVMVFAAIALLQWVRRTPKSALPALKEHRQGCRGPVGRFLWEKMARSEKSRRGRCFEI